MNLIHHRPFARMLDRPLAFPTLTLVPQWLHQAGRHQMQGEGWNHRTKHS